jgi:ATP-dependent protease HslVU (ClpYQ) peptidase subunit
MTCIVGIRRNNHVWIGGDSAGLAGWDKTPRLDPKVFLKGEFIIGYTTSFRMGQILRFQLVLPPIPVEMDLFEYMCTLFVDAVRKCLKDGGFAKKEHEVEEGGVFLVGARGRLFQIQSDFQVQESLRPYESVGCGQSYALGSLYSSRLKDPKALIIQALEAATEFSGGVGPPFQVIKI